MQYADFFRQVACFEPFPYQRALGEEPWPDILDVPTGLGKTAAVMVSWLWRRFHDDPGCGRRLVYCLPMRVLVEQVRDVARELCARAQPVFAEHGRTGRAPTVHVLMGGAVALDWDARPEEDAMVIGTQDMLLSRALNRGYGMSRYRWPVHFGLLNNDCWWVFDETQLMGVGVETSAQLQGLRVVLETARGVRSLWMSATLGEAQLDTVDHPRPAGGWVRRTLESEDLSDRAVHERVGARKAIAHPADGQLPVLDKATRRDYATQLADHVLEAHRDRGGLTLVLVNRVDRAQALYAALAARDCPLDALALVHARFRPGDRKRHQQLLDATRDDNRIVVATQAVEAGVDVSARSLFTELAPWPSLVQRFGRCNRRGEEDDARIWWIDIDTREPELVLPYPAAELERARALLDRLSAHRDAGPGSLAEVVYEPPAVVRPVLRRGDLLDLFDTTPDLCGNDVDVSRYIRDGEDTDCQLFWRDVGASGPDARTAEPRVEELCRVSVGATNKFLTDLRKKRGKMPREHRGGLRAWCWDALAGAWVEVERARPGQVILVGAQAGGYDPALGWTGEVAPKRPVPEPVSNVVAETGAGDGIEAREAEAMGSDPATMTGCWVELGEHLGHVRAEAESLARELGLDEAWQRAVCTAGEWHDVGKVHPVFQGMLRAAGADRDGDGNGDGNGPPGSGPWAKSAHRRGARCERPGFRHELASALAWLEAGADGADARFDSLVAYLIAAHHGKVRLSIRSVPGEARPPEADRPFARGVWNGDELPALDMPDGTAVGPVALDLSCMRLGPGSWLERMLALRDDVGLGPFRLAWLEMAVRVADWRASDKEKRGVY